MTLVPAAERALRIFEAFERNQQPLTLSRLAEEIEAPISSCHNLVRTLLNSGYLFSLDAQRAFYPTGKLWELARTIAAQDPLLQRITPSAETLRNATSETVIVGKRQGKAALYLLVLEGLNTIRYVAHPGRTVPLHTSAIGKALLSTLNDGDLDKWLVAQQFVQVTANSVVSHEALRSEIDTGRTRGYFATSGENVVEVGALAIPVRIGGETLAVAVAGPVARMDLKHKAILSSLEGTIRKLSGA